MGRGIVQTRNRIQYIIGIRTETRQKINEVHCSRGIYLYVYLILKLSLFVQKTGDV